MSNPEYWEFEGDWYIQFPRELPFCVNTEETAKHIIQLHTELAALQARVDEAQAKADRLSVAINKIVHISWAWDTMGILTLEEARIFREASEALEAPDD